jgi:hypothetical protein
MARLSLSRRNSLDALENTLLIYDPHWHEWSSSENCPLGEFAITAINSYRTHQDHATLVKKSGREKTSVATCYTNAHKKLRTLKVIADFKRWLILRELKILGVCPEEVALPIFTSSAFSIAINLDDFTTLYENIRSQKPTKMTKSQLESLRALPKLKLIDAKDLSVNSVRINICVMLDDADGINIDNKLLSLIQ